MSWPSTVGLEHCVDLVHLSWPDHLQAARVVEHSHDQHRGTALGLMGVALLLLAQDLLAHELDQAQRTGT